MNKRLGETNKQFVERTKREHAEMLADQFQRVANITKTGRGTLVYAPTIDSLRLVLADMEANGVRTDEPLTISHLANSLGTFDIRPLNTKGE